MQKKKKKTELNYKPGNSVSYKTACAPSEDSDQPAHVHQLIDSDQPAHKRRLIGVFACPPEDTFDPSLQTECPTKTD